MLEETSEDAERPLTAWAKSGSETSCDSNGALRPKRLLMAIASGKVSCVDRLLSIGLPFSIFFIILLFQLQFLVYRHASHLSRALSFSFRIPC